MIDLIVDTPRSWVQALLCPFTDEKQTRFCTKENVRARADDRVVKVVVLRSTGAIREGSNPSLPNAFFSYFGEYL